MSSFEDQSGKISAHTFEEVILSHCGHARQEVLIGPSFGVDTSVIALGNGLAMAVCSDPLTLIPSIGMRASAWLSVHLLANDMATTGLKPQYGQFILNLPATLPTEAFKTYWEHIDAYCKDLGIAITGGHTGKIAGQNSSIPGGGTLFSIAAEEHIITSNKAQAGDLIVVTKEAALVSTSILALCFPETVKDKLGAATQRSACDNFYRTSSLKEAVLASSILKPNTELRAMHDVTEGGILGALGEMALASNCGFRIDRGHLPVGPVVQAVADLFEIDPCTALGAGAMLMAVKADCADKLLAQLEKHDIEAVVIGRFCEADQGRTIVEDEVEKPFELKGEDPYWAAYFKALKAGLK